jgi:hypothetical protein
MSNVNFYDPKERAEHFNRTDGRPPESVIFDAVNKMVANVGPHASTDDAFLSNDLCGSIWDDYPDHHFYIGFHISRMERENLLPIRRIGIQNNRPLYSIHP